MDISEFRKRFSEDNACLDYLYSVRWENGYRCPRCNCDEMWEVSSHKYKCKNCKYQTTVTSGTLLQDTHISIAKWFEAIWWIAEKCCEVSAVDLQKELGIGSYRTVLNMVNRIFCAKMDYNSSCKLEGVVEVSCILSKVGNESTYIAVATEINNKKIGLIKAKAIKDNKHELNCFVKQFVRPGSFIVSDCWYNLNELNNEEYIKVKKHIEYGFLYVRRVYLHLMKWIQDRESKVALNESIDKYCSINNSLKSELGFDELLYRMVTKEPVPHISNLYKKMMIK